MWPIACIDTRDPRHSPGMDGLLSAAALLLNPYGLETVGAVRFAPHGVTT
jgi:hypothetical protein